MRDYLVFDVKQEDKLLNDLRESKKGFFKGQVVR